MKNTKWWILPVALLAVFGLLMTGCGGGGGGGGGGGNEVFYHSLASADSPFELTLGDNFQYGEGYQGQVKSSDLFKGEKVSKGETFWLDVTFTASRDLEDAIWAGLVDTVTGNWNPLTWDGDDKDDEGALLAPKDKDEKYIIEKDEEVSIRVEMVALKSAPSADPAENVLNIQSKGEGTKGTSGSGKEGPVKLKFTKFIFARDTAFDDSKVPGFVPKEPAPQIAIKVGGVAQQVTPIADTGDPVTINADKTGFEGYTKGYGNGYVYFEVDFGSDALKDFTSIKADYKGLTGDVKNKALWAAAWEAAPSGYYGFQLGANSFAASTANSGDPGTTLVSLTLGLGQTGTYWKSSTEPDAAYDLGTVNAGMTGKKYFIAICTHGDDSTFELSNIEFVK